jgi:hypothetical protein
MWGIKTGMMKGLGLISFTKTSTLIPQLIEANFSLGVQLFEKGEAI